MEPCSIYTFPWFVDHGQADSLSIFLHYCRADNPLTWLIKIRTPRISRSLYHTFTQNCGVWAPKLLRGASATHQSPNTIIVTLPESLGWCSNLHIEVIQQLLCFAYTCSKIFCHLLYLFYVSHWYISIIVSCLFGFIYFLHVCHLSLNGGGNLECFIKPRLDKFFNHCFLLPSSVSL